MEIVKKVRSFMTPEVRRLMISRFIIWLMKRYAAPRLVVVITIFELIYPGIREDILSTLCQCTAGDIHAKFRDISIMRDNVLKGKK